MVAALEKGFRQLGQPGADAMAQGGARHTIGARRISALRPGDALPGSGQVAALEDPGHEAAKGTRLTVGGPENRLLQGGQVAGSGNGLRGYGSLNGNQSGSHKSPVGVEESKFPSGLVARGTRREAAPPTISAAGSIGRAAPTA